MQNIISTWFYSSPKGEQIKYAQMKRYNSDSSKFQFIYWINIFCFFHSAYKTNSNARLILFLNSTPPDSIYGVKPIEFLKERNVEIKYLEKTTIAPAGYWKGWNSQFVVLDILEWFRDNLKEESNIVILDNDCLVVDDINRALIRDLQKHKVLTYKIPYPLDYKIHGLSRIELKELNYEYSNTFLKENFNYSGGEIICLRNDVLKVLCDEARAAYNQSIHRFKQGKQKFNEEAHLLSYVYTKLKFNTEGTANRFIKRIWTNRATSSNVEGNEEMLTVWHLPAEKKKGFVRMFNMLKSNPDLEIDKVKLSKMFRINPTNFDSLIMHIEKLVRKLM